MLITDFMVCLVAIIAFCVFVCREYGFAYQIALSAASCAVFSLAFGITFSIVG